MGYSEPCSSVNTPRPDVLVKLIKFPGVTSTHVVKDREDCHIVHFEFNILLSDIMLKTF